LLLKLNYKEYLKLLNRLYLYNLFNNFKYSLITLNLKSTFLIHDIYLILKPTIIILVIKAKLRLCFETKDMFFAWQFRKCASSTNRLIHSKCLSTTSRTTQTRPVQKTRDVYGINTQNTSTVRRGAM